MSIELKSFFLAFLYFTRNADIGRQDKILMASTFPDRKI